MEKKISTSKKCTHCKKEISLEKFTSQSKNAQPAVDVVRRKAASATPQKFLTRSFGQLKHARIKKEKTKKGWDITLEDVLELWDKQEGRCALTGLFMTYHKDGQWQKRLKCFY